MLLVQTDIDIIEFAEDDYETAFGYAEYERKLGNKARVILTDLTDRKKIKEHLDLLTFY